MLNNSLLGGSITTRRIVKESREKKKLAKALSSSESESKSKNKDKTVNKEKKKKRRSLSFGLFSYKFSKQSNVESDQQETSYKSTRKSSNEHQHSKAKHYKQHTTSYSNPTTPSDSRKTITSSNGASRSPKLTNKAYRNFNSSFEKAALFGQPDTPPIQNETDYDPGYRPFPMRHQESTQSNISNRSIPTILINGEAWNGVTDISGDEGDGSDESNPLASVGSNGIALTGTTECMAGGMGLREGFVDSENTFFIETEEPFDNCLLKVEIRGPKQNPIKITTHLLDDNLCSFSYWPRRIGYYMISVKWKGENIIGSPFDVGIMLRKTNGILHKRH
eukprot:TCONS_00070419-protein